MFPCITKCSKSSNCISKLSYNVEGVLVHNALIVEDAFIAEKDFLMVNSLIGPPNLSVQRGRLILVLEYKVLSYCKVLLQGKVLL